VRIFPPGATRNRRHRAWSDAAKFSRAEIIDAPRRTRADIQSFDDARVFFEREYNLDPERGVILDYESKGVLSRLPEAACVIPSTRKTGEFRPTSTVCPPRRAQENYQPEKESEDCF